MLKPFHSLALYIEDKAAHFACDPMMTIDQVKESLFQFLKHFGQVEDQMKAQLSQKAASEAPPKIEESVAPQPSENKT